MNTHSWVGLDNLHFHITSTAPYILFVYRLIQKLKELQFKHRESHLSKQINSYQVPCSPLIFKLLTMIISCIPDHKLITILLEWSPYTQTQPQKKQQLL